MKRKHKIETRNWRVPMVVIVLGLLLGVVSLTPWGDTIQLASPLLAAYDWLQFNANPQHSGNNTQEQAITLSNVSSLRQIFQVSLPSTVDGAPAYLSSVSTPSGTRDLIFATTKAGHIMALDAHNGSLVWSHQSATGPRYTTSSPAVDPNRQFVYSYGLEGRVHKYQVGDGTEITTGGWPELATLKPQVEKGSSALSIATAKDGTSYLYVANGGYPGDAGDYQGHLTTINLATGAQHVFNAACSDQTVHFVTGGSPDCNQVQTAIWGRAGVVYDPETDLIYTATGNGDFNPTSHGWGDSVLALHPDGTGAGGGPVDSYTPANFQSLQNADADLGSTIPAILPTPANSLIRHLGLQSGKDAKLRLLNLDNLSGQGGPGHVGGEIGAVIDVPQGGEVLTMPAVWVNPSDTSTWVFVANNSGLSGLQLTVDNSGMPGLRVAWQNATGGTSPVVAHGILYYARSRSIQALNPTTGAQLWQDTAIGDIHWESPIIANGVLYLTDQSGALSAYAPSCLFSLGATSQSFAATGGSGSVTINLTSNCTWSATNNTPSLITFTSPSSGSGNGTLSFTVAANSTSLARRGTITINRQDFTVFEGAHFNDVPDDGSDVSTAIGKLSARGITAGCGNGNFCPGDPVTRAQMAVLLERAMRGSSFVPPPANCVNGHTADFGDVACDVFGNFIEQLFKDGITAGCGGGNFCPGNSVSRSQMAVFLERAVKGAADAPPLATCVQGHTRDFNDVVCPDFFANFIEQLFQDGITTGCGGGNYCPGDPVSRAQMAVFLVKAFNL